MADATPPAEPATPPSPPSNPAIAALLREYADLLELRGESAFRTQAYRRGADTVAGLDRPAAGLGATALQAVEGIGKGISATIVEIARRGTFGSLDELRQIIPASVISFTTIPGIGTKTAARLYEALGVATLEALHDAAEEGWIAAAKGLGPRVQGTVLDGLAQLAVYAGRRSIGLALPLGTTLVRLLQERGVARVSLAGAVRRWAETVEEIAILAAADEPGPVLDAFAALPPIGAIIERGERELCATVDGGLTARLRVVTPARWGGELVAQTGAEAHLEALRTLANARGFGDLFARPFAEESDLYAALGLPPIPPELREGRGEIEAALAGRLPRLIERADLRGDLHAHSTWSDGGATLAQMAAAAITRGYAYLSISDHTHGLGVANGLDEARLRAQGLEIDRLNAELAPFRLLKSAEVEIRRDGTLDLPDVVLAELDVVIASLHSGLRGDRATVTGRLLRAIENPHVDIIAHPSGRIVGGRGGADYDWDAVFAAAAGTRTALEINAAPERLDLTDERARQALAAGVTLTIDCDAHSPDGLDLMPYGIAVARRAWATADRVLNTRPLDALLAWARGDR